MAPSSAAEHHEQADTITGADRQDHLRDALVIPNTIGAWDSVPLLGAVGSTSGYFFHAMYALTSLSTGAVLRNKKGRQLATLRKNLQSESIKKFD